VSASTADFTDTQLERYARQIVLRDIGGVGQARLANASAFVVGAGGLGLPALMYLAGAGIGRLGIADDDTISLSNLHRQVWYTTEQVGESKAAAAARYVQALNPDVQVHAHTGRLVEEDAPTLLSGYGIVLDCSDNPVTRHLLGGLSHTLKIPLVHGAAIGMRGYVATFDSGNAPVSPCYHCLFREEDGAAQGATCTAAGVIGPLPGVIGTLQATAAIRLLAEIGEAAHGILTSFDTARFTMRQSTITKDPECPVCSH
jgi:adenylyltransferase/sulfurtransferase